MAIKIINPENGAEVLRVNDFFVDGLGNKFPIINGVPRFVSSDNYAGNFGYQWNKFSTTQFDGRFDLKDFSCDRFFSQTGWKVNQLENINILEVGSGAGRFSRVLLEQTNANLYSIDYSDAVTANFANNSSIAPSGKFNLFQASVYAMPFENNVFDKAFCFGVLQHTPDFELSLKKIVEKTKVGGEIVVDFYAIRGWWTYVQAKYILRPFLKRMEHSKLLTLIEKNIDWLINLHFLLYRLHLGFLSRFVPIPNITKVFPKNLTYENLREWAILDTFDMFSPEHDHPKKISVVAKMFEKHGAKVKFAGFLKYGNNYQNAVIRAIKQPHSDSF